MFRLGLPLSAVQEGRGYDLLDQPIKAVENPVLQKADLLRKSEEEPLPAHVSSNLFPFQLVIKTLMDEQLLALHLHHPRRLQRASQKPQGIMGLCHHDVWNNFNFNLLLSFPLRGTKIKSNVNCLLDVCNMQCLFFRHVKGFDLVIIINYTLNTR